MTVLSALTIDGLGLVEPCVTRSTAFGMTHGLGPAGYDVTLDWGQQSNGEPINFVWLDPNQFKLAATIERFRLPYNVLGVVHDKSTWARRGLCVQNTVLEPGWQGYLTLELTNHGREGLQLWRGMPIAQVVFHYLDQPTDRPYLGKYQNQEAGPQKAR